MSMPPFRAEMDDDEALALLREQTELLNRIKSSARLIATVVTLAGLLILFGIFVSIMEATQ